MSEKNSKVDNAIVVINYILKKKKKRADELSRRLDLTESQKIFIGEENDLIKNIEVLVKQAKQTIGEHLGKLPPQTTDLETAVLGAAMIENGAFEKVRNFLKPDHFYLEQNKIVWAAVLEAGKNQKSRIEKDSNGNDVRVYDNPIDMMVVVQILRKKGKIEEVGGSHYIAHLTSQVSSSANIEAHARILIEMAIKRQLILMASSVLHDAYDDTTDCFEILESAETQIKEINGWIK